MSQGNVRKYGDRPSHPIYVWNGLLEPKHRKRIGPALWEFLWCLDRITKEKEGVGIVLGGKPVTCAEIAEDLGSSERTTRRNLARLYSKGYLDVIRTPRGYGIRVVNSCKFPQRSHADVTPMSHGENGRSDRPEMAGHSDKSGRSRGENGRSNIRESSLSKQLEKAVEKTAAYAAPFPPSFKSFPKAKTEKELDETRRLLLRQGEEIRAKYAAGHIPRTAVMP